MAAMNSGDWSAIASWAGAAVSVGAVAVQMWIRNRDRPAASFAFTWGEIPLAALSDAVFDATGLGPLTFHDSGRWVVLVNDGDGAAHRVSVECDQALHVVKIMRDPNSESGWTPLPTLHRVAPGEAFSVWFQLKDGVAIEEGVLSIKWRRAPVRHRRWSHEKLRLCDVPYPEGMPTQP